MKQENRNAADLLSILVFGVFALCVLLVLLTGARIYRDLVGRGEADFTLRTALQYTATRVHQARSVTLQDFEGCPALVIPETVDEETYLTRIYYHDGYLRELYSTESARLSPADGEKVLETAPVFFSFQGPVLTVSCEDARLLLYIPSERRVLP